MNFVRNLFGNRANAEAEEAEGQIPKELLRLHPMFQSGGFTYSLEESLTGIESI